jgi:hypothetical protein
MVLGLAADRRRESSMVGGGLQDPTPSPTATAAGTDTSNTKITTNSKVSINI